MDQSGQLFDARYYASHCGSIPYERGQSHWPAFFGGIAEQLIRAFNPHTVFDAGCAHGFLVEAFWDRGIEAHGRDISDFAISQVRVDLAPFCAVGSLAEPIEGRYDLITCIEVLEHMEQAEALKAIEAMTRASGRILFSSSPLDLTEETHINVKPPIYWLERFAEQGFAPRSDFDPSFITPWAIVFERAETGRSPADLVAAALLIRQRLQSHDASRIITELQASIQQLMAQADAATRQLPILQARADAEQRRADDAERAHARALQDVAEGERRFAEAITVSREIRSRAEAAELRAAQAQHDLHHRHAADCAALLDQLHRVEHEHQVLLASSSWRATAPIRSLSRRMPRWLRRRALQTAKLAWWTVTFQLGRRARQWRAARRARAAR